MGLAKWLSYQFPKGQSIWSWINGFGAVGKFGRGKSGSGKLDTVFSGEIWPKTIKGHGSMKTPIGRGGSVYMWGPGEKNLKR